MVAGVITPTVSGMFIRSAPASSAALHISFKNFTSVLVASMGENSHTNPWFLMYCTDSMALDKTCSCVRPRACFICTSEVEINVWTESTSHSMTASISSLRVRARPHISAFSPALAIFLTAVFSPLEVIGVPASITSTPNLSSRSAISNFSSGVRDTPGVCSPSLSVVSNIWM